MYDDTTRLDDASLCRLLRHYRDSAGDDREAWQDRVTEWEGGGAAELSRWHGSLLAAAWVEQNTGATPRVEAGKVSGCYRVTAAGRQALKRVE